MEIMESSSNFRSFKNCGTATVDKSLNLATLFATENCKQIKTILKLVRCPKGLFDKFNILEFKRGAE